MRLRRTVICLFFCCGFLIVFPFSLTEPPRAFYKFGRGRQKERRRRRSWKFFRNVGPSQIIQTYVQLSWVKAKPSRRGIYLRSYLHARLACKMGSLLKLEAPVGSITAHFFIWLRHGSDLERPWALLWQYNSNQEKFVGFEVCLEGTKRSTWQILISFQAYIPIQPGSFRVIIAT